MVVIPPLRKAFFFPSKLFYLKNLCEVKNEMYIFGRGENDRRWNKILYFLENILGFQYLRWATFCGQGTLGEKCKDYSEEINNAKYSEGKFGKF